ncbi:hypothetical protein KKF04_00520, partial [Patescibacteria group bacterium]|nr:hypothetical protein [Patescibacteria group bacterium]
STQVTLDGDQIIITGKNNLHVLFGGRDTVSISVERSRESMYRVLSGSDDVEVITVDGEEVWSNVTQ